MHHKPSSLLWLGQSLPAPYDVEAYLISSDSVRISWKLIPQAYSNVEIIGYDVLVDSKGENTSNKRVFIGDTWCDYLLSDFERGKRHIISVAVETADSIGEYSKPVILETPPGKLTQLELCI